jgi:hypothetical protein
VATVTWDQVKTIAEGKMPDLNAFTVESAMRMVQEQHVAWESGSKDLPHLQNN